ncbi:MAG: hypothetical protein CM15mP120_24170 [Pseudomonadota bacterium]|nr:MAG: hypothetical protein CM15mP120_24170 [Pseudomonadota bacterium]
MLDATTMMMGCQVAMEHLASNQTMVVMPRCLLKRGFPNALLNLAVNRIVAVEGGGKFSAGFSMAPCRAIADGGKNQSREKQWI